MATCKCHTIFSLNMDTPRTVLTRMEHRKWPSYATSIIEHKNLYNICERMRASCSSACANLWMWTCAFMRRCERAYASACACMCECQCACTCMSSCLCICASNEYAHVRTCKCLCVCDAHMWACICAGVPMSESACMRADANASVC